MNMCVRACVCVCVCACVVRRWGSIQELDIGLTGEVNVHNNRSAVEFVCVQPSALRVCINELCLTHLNLSESE